MKNKRTFIASAIAGLMVAAGLVGVAQQPAQAFVSQNGSTRSINGCNTTRGTNQLIVYTRVNGRTSTRTNSAGFEAAFLNGRITRVQNGVGNMTIPTGGAVISGNGTARTWLQNVMRVNQAAELRPRCAAVPAQPAPNYTVTTQTTTTRVNGCDTLRRANYLVAYSRLYGQTRSPANAYGYEVAIQGGRVVGTSDMRTGMAIPTGGAVLSGHGTARLWLRQNLPMGAWVSLPTCSGVINTARPTTPPPVNNSPLLLPDLRLRDVNEIFIDTEDTPGQKQLRFKAVTANVGAGPFEVVGTRSSTSQPHVVTQRILRQDGTYTSVPARRGTTAQAEFYFAGDGHNHWHVRDFDEFVLTDMSGDVIATQEKHGFCFEDNTEYRNWPSEGVNGTNPNPVYIPGQVCGANNPQALIVNEGISKGWSDTYSAALPDQFIDITGLADGEYRLRQTADWANWFQETNETNNRIVTTIRIQGNSVSILSSEGGA